MSGPPARIPALVVSGFLGSGKTTLVRNLLEDAKLRRLRVAFVSNEIGALGIDRALLGGGAEAFVELEGGCVCCELSDDLVETLQTLYEQVRPDRIVIETSGAALPFDTTLNFWREPVSTWIGEDTTVVVVNAEQVHEGRDLEGAFADQVSSADLLILNKVDLVPEAELPALEATLRGVEAETPIVHSVRGDVPSDLLFPPELAAPSREGPAPAAPPHSHAHLDTEEWRPEPGQSTTALEARLAGRGLLRAKGFVETDEGLRLLQLVGHRIEWSTPEAEPPAELRNRVILIAQSRDPA